MGAAEMVKPGEAEDQNQPQRVRICFAKTDAMRFIGNLDLFKAWERACRRAGLPLAYSQGYNPQPKLNLASALPLGFTSQAELIDIWLEQPLPLEAIESGLRSGRAAGDRNPGNRGSWPARTHLAEPAGQRPLPGNPAGAVSGIGGAPGGASGGDQPAAAAARKTMTCARYCWKRAPCLRMGTGTPGWSCSCRWAKAPPGARTKYSPPWATIRMQPAWSVRSWCF